MSDSTEFRLDPSAVCDACGCFGAYRFDGETLCAECYAGRGSCCSKEFSGRGRDETDDNPPARPCSPASVPPPPAARFAN